MSIVTSEIMEDLLNFHRLIPEVEKIRLVRFRSGYCFDFTGRKMKKKQYMLWDKNKEVCLHYSQPCTHKLDVRSSSVNSLFRVMTQMVCDIM